MHLRAGVLVIAFGGTWLGVEGAARACASVGISPAPSPPAVLPADEVPRRLELVAAEVRRGRGPCQSGTGSKTGSSCDDLGLISLTVKLPDAGQACAFAFVMQLAGGAPPSGVVIPPGLLSGTCNALTPNHAGFEFLWSDGNTDQQEPFSFDLEMRAIDGKGKESPPAVFHIEHDGRPSHQCPTSPADTSGCALISPTKSADGALSAVFTTTAMVIAALVRRRARRRAGHHASKGSTSIGRQS
ncbi:MAG TPA: hypothetical protein VGG33_02525 [Polyangia bacterium]